VWFIEEGKCPQIYIRLTPVLVHFRYFTHTAAARRKDVSYEVCVQVIIIALMMKAV
jgi:hypothetical protein